MFLLYYQDTYSKILTGTYEGGYAYVFKMCCYRTLEIVINIVANFKIYI